MAKNKSANKQQQYTPTCIFCKGSPVTLEHLWPQWIERELSKQGEDKHIFNNFQSLTYNNSRMRVSSRVQNRNIGRLVVKRVCSPCNNGWMSRVETESKAIVKSLILDEPVILTSDEQTRLSRWAVLRSIIGEYANNEVVKVISKEDRLSFYQTTTPSANFKIWIGRSQATENDFRQLFIHFTAYMAYQNIIPFGVPDPNVKWSLFVKNSLLIIVFWSERECDVIMPHLINDKLVQIYPLAYDSISSADISPLSQQEMAYIRENLTRDSLAVAK